MDEIRFLVYSKEQLNSEAAGASGAKKIGVSPLSNVQARDVQGILEEFNGRAGAADASPTRKGIGKLSRAAADPADPIFVGDNDPRLNGRAKGIFKATKTAGQTINASNAATNPSPTLLTRDALEYHPGGGFDLVGKWFAVPTELAGFWEFEVVLEILGVEAASNCQVEVLKNGAVVHARYNHSGSVRAFSALGGYEGLLAAGDVITTRMAYHSGASTDTALIGAAHSYFRGHFKGAA